MKSGARRTTRRSQGAGDLVLVAALAAGLIGLSGVVAGFGEIRAGPIPYPMTAAEDDGRAPRDLDVSLIPATVAPLPIVAAPMSLDGNIAEWNGPPKVVAHGDALHTERRGDRRRDLLELGAATWQRGVTGHQAAIGHADVP